MMSRASFFACLRRDSSEGRGGRDFEGVIAPPFMNRLCPAETRLKEVQMHVTQIKQMGCSLAAGWWRPVSALLAVSRGVPPRCQKRSCGFRLQPEGCGC